MSKRKRRRRGEVRRDEINTNAPFGINPAQLMGLLGNNVDFNQIGNMLSSMKMDGLDLNNFNLNNQASSQVAKPAFDLGPLQGFMSSLGLSDTGKNNNSNMFNNSSNAQNDVNEENEENEVDEISEEHINISQEEFNKEEFLEEDENIQMLIAIKSIVDSKKALFLERVIEEYNKGMFK